VGILDALQGFSNNPAAQQGLLAAGLGMLAGNTGGVSTGQLIGRGGLLGMNAYAQAGQTQRQAQQDELKAAMMAQQMQQVDAETQMKQQQLAQAQRQFNLQAGILGQLGLGGGADASAPANGQGGMMPASLPANVGGSALSGALAGAAPAAMGTAAPAAAPAGMRAGGGMGGGAGPLGNLSESQKVRMGLDLAFNSGKTLADIAKPSMSVENGIVVDMNRMQPGETLPMPDGTQWMPLGNGQYKLTMAPGAADVAAQKRDIQNAGELVPTLNAAGQQVLTPKTQAAGAVSALNPAQQSYMTAMSERDSKKLSSYLDARETAPGQIGTYQQLGSALESFAGTGTSPKSAQLQQWAKQWVPGYQPGQALSSYQVAQSVSNQLALELRNPASGAGMPGAMSDGDRQFLASMVANPGTDITAARQMIDARMRTLQRQQEIGDKASKWARAYGQLSGTNSQGQDFYDALSQWSNANPLFPTQQNGAAPAAGGR
jgi:hypothetical protein